MPGGGFGAYLAALAGRGRAARAASGPRSRLTRDARGTAQEVRSLLACQEEHPWGRYFGKCDTIKVALDKCFRAEKNKKRLENAASARRQRQRLAELMEDPAAGAAAARSAMGAATGGGDSA